MNGLIDQCVQGSLVWDVEQILSKDSIEEIVIGTSLVKIVLVIFITFWRVTHGETIDIKDTKLRLDGTIVDAINLTTI